MLALGFGVWGEGCRVWVEGLGLKGVPAVRDAARAHMLPLEIILDRAECIVSSQAARRLPLGSCSFFIS